MSHKGLLRLIEIVGSQRKLSKLLGVSQQTVNFWAAKKRSLPAQHVIKAVELTRGLLTPHDLRPDIFDKRFSNKITNKIKK